MSKTLLSTLLALILLVSLASPVMAAETGLGISPASFDIILGEGESGTQDFYTYYFTGTVTVEAVDIPVTVSPSSFEVSSSPSALSLTLKNIASNAGVYNGYLRFTGLSTDNTGLAIQIDVNVSVTATVGASLSGSGGGGGGGGGYIIRTDLFGKFGYHYTERDGNLLGKLKATSQDGILTVNLSGDTVALGLDGKRLKTLGIAIDENPPAPPVDANIIGLPYVFSPAGATFDPPITFTWAYDPAVDPQDLIIAFYDGTQWVELPCTVDYENGVIVAEVAHFTTIAMLEVAEPVVAPIILPPTITPPPVKPFPVMPTPAPVVKPVPVTPTPSVEPPEEPSIPTVLEDNGWSISKILGIIIGILVVVVVLMVLINVRRRRDTKGKTSDLPAVNKPPKEKIEEEIKEKPDEALIALQKKEEKEAKDLKELRKKLGYDVKDQDKTD